MGNLFAYSRLPMKRLNPETNKPFTSGDVREDGYIFRRYNLSRKRPNGEFLEQWYSPKAWADGRKRDKTYNDVRAVTMREEVHAYKLSQGCTDCGYKAHASALDFDHMPGHKKLFTIGARPHSRPEAIWAEIAKCEVVCANCHRVRTWNRGTDFSTRKGQPGISKRQKALAA